MALSFKKGRGRNGGRRITKNTKGPFYCGVCGHKVDKWADECNTCCSLLDDVYDTKDDSVGEELRKKYDEEKGMSDDNRDLGSFDDEEDVERTPGGIVIPPAKTCPHCGQPWDNVMPKVRGKATIDVNKTMSDIHDAVRRMLRSSDVDGNRDKLVIYARPNVYTAICNHEGGGKGDIRLFGVWFLSDPRPGDASVDWTVDRRNTDG